MQPENLKMKQYTPYEERLITVIDSINSAYSSDTLTDEKDHVWLFRSVMNSLRRYKNSFYGYDESDKLLEYFLEQVNFFILILKCYNIIICRGSVNGSCLLMEIICIIQ